MFPDMKSYGFVYFQFFDVKTRWVLLLKKKTVFECVYVHILCFLKCRADEFVYFQCFDVKTRWVLNKNYVLKVYIFTTLYISE